jgi:3-dehydroquinate synthase
LKNSTQYQTVRVPLGERSYPIYIGKNLLSSLGRFFHRHRLPKTVVIITDRNVARLYLKIAQRSLVQGGFDVRVIVVPPGEKEKNLRRADAVYSALLRFRIERRSTIVALGGGVVGDLAGFIAATYQRGVNFVQVPTTLLAQVDSSVGGKVGVNHARGKNMVGAFYQPAFVVADVATLRTLPDREIVCGVGEVVKYGIIMNRKFFSFVDRNLPDILAKEGRVLAHLVAGCCRMKALVVSQDEREDNLRAILNFGHTVGHALEHAGSYRSLKHGESILLGMIAETFVAYRLGMISSKDAARIEGAILKIPMPRSIGFSFAPPKLIDAMRLDKKVAGGKIRFVLPTSVGKVTLPIVVDEKIILESLVYLRAFLLSKAVVV